MRIQNLVFLVLIIACLSACSEHPVYSKKVKIEKLWSYEDAIDFTFEVVDIENPYDLILTLGYDRDFGYQNLYVKVETTYPDSNKVSDIVSLNLTNAAGIFLGECTSGSCKIDILLQERFKFKENGSHKISISQHGREEQLEYIEYLELKLFKFNQ